MARLIANLPCLKAGYPPIIIDKEQRYTYMTTLSEYQGSHGVPSIQFGLIYEDALLEKFEAFYGECWSKSRELVDQAQTHDPS